MPPNTLPATERRERLLILAQTKDDWALDSQRIGSRSHASSSPSPSGKRRCSRCRATGRVLDEGTRAVHCDVCREDLDEAEENKHRWTRRHKGCRPCLRCNDTGWVRSSHGSSQDPMLQPGEIPGVETSNRKHSDRRAAEAQLRQVEAQLARAEGRHVDTCRASWTRRTADCTCAVAQGDEDYLSRAVRRKEEQHRRGDYPALERALRLLHDRYPLRHQTFVACVVHQTRTASPLDEIDETADWLASLMPEVIRLPSGLEPPLRDPAVKENLHRGRHPRTVQRRNDRDALIRQEARAGCSTAELSERHGYSVQHIRRILRSARDDDEQAA